MILDYIGQELIWRLKGTHPYELNSREYCIRIRCFSPKQNNEIRSFIVSHLSKEIAEIIYEDTPFVCGDEKVVKEIQVNNVFGGISTVRILNEAEDIGNDKRTRN